MTQKLIICRGLPASGKSTWAKEFVRNNPQYVRINNDELRSMLNIGKFSKENEAMISETRHSIISSYLKAWYNVIIDNTNLNPATVEADVASAYWTDVKVEFKDFLVDVDECIRRDSLRWEASVGGKVIREMSNKWNWKPEPPREFAVIPQDNSLPKAFIFDIDWTLAYMNGRDPHDFSRVHEDGVHEDVKGILFNLYSLWYKILIVSGRGEECRKETIEWLNSNIIPYDELFMRKLWDKRKDSIVKYEILKNDITPNYYIQWIFDDRDCVVKMARESGFRVYQVNYGNF